MQPVRFAVGTFAAALLAWPALQAHAEPPGLEAAMAAARAAHGAAPETASTSTAPPTVRTTLFAGVAKAVPVSTLDDIRGGAEVTVNDMRLHGTVADNAAVNTLSGTNHITEGAFSNAAGIPTAIQNSGSNVLIQNATIVNVQFK
ncbi:conserved hypothetical protein; putative exported protein [Cupriavidus taiwanensis]|uniref:hypothetical protein n=1 Tax=Cupriavidus taiwanensis TaxID=164546 RepID=UPI000E18F672|nr:hypothetical protein [Cupriavidus taiwanensis]SOY93577.1 conserved hypothetical protein; putative exported protein [Cupriavidus taiwanensis]SOY96087.1 conserved hypothetical protein; putative exported protein [Cupriavidus taiwanensis]